MYCNNTRSGVDLTPNAQAICIAGSVNNLNISGGYISSTGVGWTFCVFLDQSPENSNVNISGNPLIMAQSIDTTNSSAVAVISFSGMSYGAVDIDLDISGSPVISASNSNTIQYSAGIDIRKNNGNVVINGGTITGGTYGIIQVNPSECTGSITVGDADVAISTTTPCIQGGEYGVHAPFTFNNGIIKGATPYTATPTVRDGVDIASGTDATYTNTRYLEIRNYQNVQKGTYYETLQSAIDDAISGNTIKLLKDVTDSTAITVNKNIVFDTNGFVLTKNTNTITINENCTLEMNDTGATLGRIWGNALMVTNNGTLKMTNGIIRNSVGTKSTNKYTVQNNSTGTIIVQGGVLSSKYRTIRNDGGTINLTSGTISAVWNAESAVDVAMYTIVSNGGTINISGGTLSSDNTSSNDELGTTAYAMALFGSADNVNITGGNIWAKGTGSSYAIDLRHPLAGSKLNISGNPTISAETVDTTGNAYAGAIRLYGEADAPVTVETNISGTPTIMGKPNGSSPNILGMLIKYNNSPMTIKSGTITAAGIGISCYDSSTLTIGDETTALNKVSPCIQGLNHGIKGAFVFSNGIIKGATPYNTTPTVRTGAVVVSGTDATYTNTRYLAKDISLTTVTDPSGIVYDGTAKRPTIVVKDGGTTLTKDTDYTVEYTNNTNAGTATITITGIGAYGGTKEVNFTIATRSVIVTPVAMSKFFGDQDPVLAYTVSGYVGEAPAFIGALTRAPGEAVGTYAISRGTLALAETETNYTFTFVGSDDEPDTIVYFRINAKDASDAIITLDEYTYTYDGTAKRPTPTVRLTEGGEPLVVDVDYSVSYENNIVVSSDPNKNPTVVIEFIGNYTGEAREEFVILKADRNVVIVDGNGFPANALHLFYNNSFDVTVGYTGEAATVTASSENTNIATSTATENNSASGLNCDHFATVSVTPIGQGETEITVNIPETNNYNSASATIYVMVLRATAELTVSPTEMTLVAQGSNRTASYSYNGDGTVTAISSNTSVATVQNVSNGVVTIKPRSAGTAIITLSATQTDRYEAVADDENDPNVSSRRIVVTVNPSGLDISFSETPSFVYDGQAKMPEVVVMANSTVLTENVDYTLAYSDCVDAGTASVNVTGIGSYTGSSGSITYTIAQAPLTIRANNKSKVYREDNPALDYTVEGLITGQTIGNTGSLETTAVKNFGVGSYPIRQGTFALINNGTFKVSNYDLTFVNGTLTVTGKSITSCEAEVTGSYSYTGSAITPGDDEVSLRDGEIILVKGVDYTVAYTDNTNAGTATATFTGIGNYSGTKETTFTIGKSNAGIGSVTMANWQYGQTAKNATTSSTTNPGSVTLVYKLQSEGDETYTATKPTNAGNYTVRATFEESANYSEVTATANFSITARPISNATVADIAAETYDGSEKRPTVTVSDGAITITAEDYDVAYSDNTNAGTASITITGKRNYTGTKVVNFTIEKADRVINLSNSNLSLVYGTNGSVTVTYTGEPVTVTAVSSATSVATVTSTSNGIVDGLENVAVTVTPVGQGSATITVTVPASDNYSAKTETFEVSVAKATGNLSVSENTLELVAQGDNGEVTYTYSGNGTITVTSSDSTVATVSKDGNTISIMPIKAGTATITVSVATTSQYNGDSKEISVTVTSSEISVAFSETPSYTYDGNAKTPSVVVTANGNTLTENTEYSLSYENNTNAGTARVIVTGIGNYTGSTGSITFEIARKALTITANDKSRLFGESNPTLDYVVSGLVGGETIGSTGNLATTATISSNVGTYPITQGTFTLADNGAFKVNNYNLTFVNGTLTITTASGLAIPTLKGSYVYTGRIQVAELNNFDASKMTATNNTRTDAGTQQITISLKDKVNYAWSDGTTTDKTISWTIEKAMVANPTLTSVRTTYDGSAHEITITGTSLGTLKYRTSTDNSTWSSWTETKPSLTNVGKLYIEARVEGNDNYNNSATVTGTIEIVKKKLIVIPTSNLKKSFGEQDPELSYVVSKMVSGEIPSFTGSLSREEGESFGSYAITQGTLQMTDKGAFKADNYQMVFIGGARFGIVPKSIVSEGMVITVGSATYTYGSKPNEVTITGTTPIEYVYTGEEIEPEVTVRDTIRNVTLTQGVDYFVEYSNNTAVGKGTVKVIGVGSYNETATYGE